MAVLSVDLFRDLDRLSDQGAGPQTGSARSPRVIPVDLYRLGDHYVLHADLPGVDPGSVDINVENQTLTIKAERTPSADEAVQWIGSERVTGAFARRLSLGANIDTEAISATYENGVLTVTIPISDRARARRIAVTTQGNPGASHDAPSSIGAA